MKRYAQLIGIIEKVKPATIIEIGTWNGDRALQMANAALAEGDAVHYMGFDLFEGATEKTDAEELNVKKHWDVRDVRDKLNNFAQEFEGFSFVLHKGNTRDTIHGKDVLSGLKKPVLAFIDGGHSIETIKGDFEALKDADVVILDDYYIEDDDGKIPDITKYGCNLVLEQYGDEDKDWFIMPVPDPVKDGGRVCMVSWGRKFDIQMSQSLQVRTKNSVSDDAIQRNILFALGQGYPEVDRCYPHGTRAVVVSGGPSFLEHLDDIRELQKKGCFLVCVKTSHDQLIERGIIPDACILLDPRAHVTEFIQKPHPDTVYYVASQVYWETVAHLNRNGANVVLYHAMVNAGEEKMLGSGRYMILGGSTSATRGLSLLHTIGFRDFVLYGYDGSFAEKPGEDYIKKHEGKQGKMPIKVKVLEAEFWTTPELVAQARDIEQLLDPMSPNEGRIELIGSDKSPTMMQHLYDKTYKPKAEFKWRPRKPKKKAA